MRRIVSASITFWLVLSACPASAAGPYAADIRRTNDPNVYVTAFHDVISIRLIRLVTGKSYSAYRDGDLTNYGMPRGGYPLCQMDDMPTGWLDRPDKCRITHFNPIPDCKSEDGCVSLTLAPELLLTYRAEILQAVSAPCEQLEDPTTLFNDLDHQARRHELRARAKSVGYSIEQQWDIFHCDRKKHVSAKRTLIDDDKGALTIWF